ncbi:MAG: glycosyltransferase family 4 protein [Thermoplasmata archaeon]
MARVVMLLTNPHRPDPRVRREAIALGQDGHTIWVHAWDRQVRYPTSETMDGIEVRRIRLAASYDSFLDALLKLPLVWGRMLWRLRSDPFDVVHAHDLDTLPVGILLAKLRRKPCVFDAHEVYSTMVQPSVPRWAFRFLRWLEKTLTPACQVILTVNDALRGIYEGLGGRRVVVVMNAAPLSELEGADPDQVRRNLQLQDKPIILYAGVLEPSRSLDHLLAAFEEFEEGILVLGGHGSLTTHIDARAASLENVRFVGWIPARDMASYLAAADVVVLLYDPTYAINRIGTATRLLEAMALGVPIVASEGSSNGEVVREEAVGLTVRHDDVADIRRGIRRLLSDAELRHAAARNGRRAARERYSWEVQEERLRATYRQLTEPEA